MNRFLAKLGERMTRVFAMLLLLAAPAIAAASGGGEGHAEPKWSLTLWGFVNFAIFCFIMARFAWPLVRDFLQDRRDGVIRALEGAARARREAEQLKADFELRMKSLESEAARAREEILSLAQADATRLVEQAEKTAEHIRRDAQLVADQEVARARRALQEESAELVTRMAADLVAARVQPDDQNRFIQEFLAETREVTR